VVKMLFYRVGLTYWNQNVALNDMITI